MLDNLHKKRLFDLIVCLAAACIWVPICAIGSIIVLLFSGRPAFYGSRRIIGLKTSRKIFKFRAMTANAEKIVNRDTIPVTNQRFLNILPDSPLYTPIGRIFEGLCLTEIPQLFEVLFGYMSLVGSRPLPENVVKSLQEVYPITINRFRTKCGMTGPVQLVGRIFLSDEERLKLEAAYCRLCFESWTVKLDMMILLYTILIGIHIHRPFTAYEVNAMMKRYAKRDNNVAFDSKIIPIQTNYSKASSECLYFHTDNLKKNIKIK